jgi:alanine racemase
LHKRPTAAYIDLRALEHNYLELRHKITPGANMMAVVKANAYGHGAVEVARALEELGCACFGVAIPEEGIQLREAGISRPITVLGGIFPDQAEDIIEHNLTPVVFDMAAAGPLTRLPGSGAVFAVHVKLTRAWEGSAYCLGRASIFSGLKGPELRVACFRTRRIRGRRKTTRASAFWAVDHTSLGVDPGLLEMANSAALVDFEEAHLGMVRPGIMLYGSYPTERLRGSVKLKPVMQLKTRVLFIKSVPAGFNVSYGRRFTTTRPSLIATLPIGYADGVPRKLGNSGEVLIGGRRAPIAGTVCMDLTMVDVTGVPGVKTGAEAVIIGTQGSESIPAEEVADRAGTISYEIFCGISARVPRVYTR